MSELPYAILSAGWWWHELKLDVLADVENLASLTRLLGITHSNRLVEFWGRAIACTR